MATFNLADLYEIVADAVPGREALVAAERRLTFAELEDRSNRLAHHLAAHGVGRGDHVGLLMRNGTEYVEGMLAAFKLRAVPINVNFRYVADELRYLFDDADIVALVRDAEFQAPRVATEIVVGEDYERALAAASPARDFEPRSSDDVYCAYTGGTTGLPKGVLWRHEDIFFAAMGGGDPYHAGNVVARPDELAGRVPQQGMVALATPPLMHVSAHWLVFSLLFAGGRMAFTPRGRFDPAEVWRTVERERVNMLVIVGDAMGRPLAEWLQSNECDTSSLVVVGSGGALLSPSTKEALAVAVPNAMVVDGFGSSESGTMGTQATFAGAGPAEGPRFRVNEQTAVLGEDLRPVEPGSGVVGRLARRGHVPIGYHKDPERTAATIVEVDGERWVIPGDFGTVEPDGTISLLGRGAVSINTGGEKVFPEEVEAVLKGHPGVADALVVGVPDERWGERVVALVQARAGAGPSLEDMQAFCRERLAAYKAPRALCLVEAIVRSPAGKPDYRWAREHAVSTLGL